jgi:hypothetical protein
MSRSTLRGASLVSLLFALAVPSAVWAQGVFKCTVKGKTVYLAEPCEGQGRSLELTRGPSELDIQEARKRASADKNRASEADARIRERSAQQTQRIAQAAARTDCTALSSRRASAYGRRNGAFRATRMDNIDRSADVISANNEIASVEAQMSQAGCSLQ